MEREHAAPLGGVEQRHGTRDRDPRADQGRDVVPGLSEWDRRRLDHEGRMIALAETVTAGLFAWREEEREAVRNARSDAETRLAEIADALARTLDRVRSLDAVAASLRAEIEVGDALNAEYLAENESLKAHVGDLERSLAAIMQAGPAPASAHGSSSVDSLADQSSLAPSWNSSAASEVLSGLYADLVRHREARPQRLLTTFRHDALWDDVAPAFAELKAYAGANIRRGGYRLALSEDLGALDYREYAMPMALERLSRVHVAVNPLAPSEGLVGVEVVSADEIVLAQTTRPLADISGAEPAAFALATGPLAPGWRLRVFARQATAPVTVYELVHPSVLRRRPRRLPFVRIE